VGQSGRSLLWKRSSQEKFHSKWFIQFLTDSRTMSHTPNHITSVTVYAVKHTHTEIQWQIYFHVFVLRIQWFWSRCENVLHLLLIQWVCLEFHSLLRNIGKHWEGVCVCETLLLTYWNRWERKTGWSGLDLCLGVNLVLAHTHTHTHGGLLTYCVF